ncbi:inositol polyphosphate kinase-like protein [Leishmania major strain Friedlin]|uniref:Kinase n=1 Tax=Leishmania major TaxID=5664 RepID=Q4QFV1_LEIMA|nr:inositol polyphosphate kinase-like protein [Leishmania major strain Friedlin]CAG9571217.1 inositol_polyphosphate_kinase-like_protein_-_putative [Leishmania major strain Friedlin]CAJ02751.1 inositol polyphosphate kinase-like protein [Leishmania major strain Friedlin]|eukprot:XP_001687633.1 inositol polyphosphate kinase-like protein [Leishmania major strain Friedlin]
MHKSLSRSTFNAVFEHLSAEEQRASRQRSVNASFDHRPQQQQPLRPMSGQALDTAVEVVALCDRAEGESTTSQAEEPLMPLLRDMNDDSTDALKLCNSSDELDGYCSSCEGSLPDNSASSSSEDASRATLSTSVAAALRKDARRKPHSRHHRHRYRGRGSLIRSAARDEEWQRLVAMSFDESTAMAKAADSDTTTMASPVVSTPAVAAAGGAAREGAFKGMCTPYPKPITATTNTKTSLAMISAALNVESRTAEADTRSNSDSPCSKSGNAVGNTLDAVLLHVQVPALARDGRGGESARALRSSAASLCLLGKRDSCDAAEVSIDRAAGDQCILETSPTAMSRPPILSPAGTLSLAGTAVITSNGNNNGSNSSAVGAGDALQVTSCDAMAPPPVEEAACVAPAAVGLMKSSTVNVYDGFVTLTAAANPLQEATQGPSAEPRPDKTLSISPAGEAAAETTGVALQAAPVAGVATLTSTNATIPLGHAAAETSSKHLQDSSGSPTHVDLSSSSSVGGHHLSVTEGSVFLKQSGSRREEAFYNMIQPYQEALVRKAVRQAPHTVQHWSQHHAGTPCAGVQQGAASTAAAASPSSKAGHLSPLHASASHRQRDDDSDSVVADPDDVAAMCEARWEAYQQYEAEDMSNLNILASEQLAKKNAGCERQRGGGGGDCAGLLYNSPSSPTSLRQVDKDLVELAARLWWTVRCRHFYRTSAPAYEVQRQAAEAASLSPLSSLAWPPAATTCGSGGAAVTYSLDTAPASQQPHHAPHDSLEALPPTLPLSPMSASMIEQEKAEHRGEAAAALAPSVSGTATPCMVGSFAASLLEGLTSSSSAAERQYAVQKHRALQLFAAFVPRYHGTRRLFARDVLRCESKKQPQQPGKQQIVVDADNDDDEDNNSGDKKICHMIMLEYVCYRFRRPCVMDIKMGSRQYGLHPSAEKKRSKERKARLSTSARYGIRLAGYRRWNADEGRYNCRSKLQCRCLSLNEVKSEMSTFLLHSREMEQVFRRQLQRLRVAFSQQTIFRFYTSSLLFVYDADDPLKTARVTMVDFAYTYESKELLQGGDPDADFDYDVGYLKALDTLLSLLA